MKILINYQSDSETATGKIYARHLKELGHDVFLFSDIVKMRSLLDKRKLSFLQRIANWNLQKKHARGFLQGIAIKSVLPVLNRVENKINRDLLSLCQKVSPDVLVVFKGRLIKPETLKEIRKLYGSKLCYYNGDNHFNLYSTTNNMLMSLTEYDLVLSWSRRLLQELRKNGAIRVEYLPFGYEPHLHSSRQISSEDQLLYGCDISFVGTWDKAREKVLSTLSDLDIGIWGPNWNRISTNSGLSKRIKGLHVDTMTQGKICKASKVCLNIMRDQNCGSHNMKTFEIPAMGGFMITNRSQEHSFFFDEGLDIGCFDSIDELREQVLRYINDDGLREQMLKRAHKKVINSHSYFDRAKLLCSYLQK